MTKKIKDINSLQKYIHGVDEKSVHHAQSVSSIIYALIGIVISYKDMDSNIEVLVKDGDVKNVIWFKVDGKRFALSYNHDNGLIELRERSLRGDTIATFDNNTSIEEIIEIFENMYE